ncbi:MAG: hypothetical protein ABIU87_13905 [Ornithinibacter sp.]
MRSQERWGAMRPTVPAVAIGVACVAIGGILSAVNSVDPTEHGSWAAAYLVLVMGLGQIALALGQALLSSTPTSRPVLLTEVVSWNLGGALVLIGTLVGPALLVNVGGILLVVTLALVVTSVRTPGPGPRWHRILFLALVLVLLVSIPIGLVLSRTS